MLIFLFPLPSDPYVKVTVYDPVNGVLTSVQTKTIKKVSHLTFVGVVVLFGLFWSDSRQKVNTTEIWELVCHLSERTWGKECSLTYSVSLFMALFWYFLFNNTSER